MSAVFASLQSRTVSLRGLTIHYFVGGSGTPVVLIHGLGSSAGLEWRFNLEALAAEHQVYGLDLPGFGLSDKPALDYRLSFFVEVVRSFLEAQDLKHVALMGASFGGRIALGVALEAPEVTERLVLVDALGVGVPRRVLHYRLLLLRGLGELMLSSSGLALRRLNPSLIRRLWRWYQFRARANELALGDSQLADYQRLMAIPAYRAAYLATLRSVASLRSLHDGVIVEERLGELGMPTLLIWGRHDQVFPASHAEAAQRRMQRSRVVVFEHSGHTPQLEEPERFNRLVLDFLRESSSLPTSQADTNILY